MSRPVRPRARLTFATARTSILRRLGAIVRQRCPRCLEGRVFRGTIAMNDTCPQCGYVFLKEQGYFQGAMYLSYGMGVLIMFALAGLFSLFTRLEVALAIAVPVFFVLVPVVWRYSRVLWLHANVLTGERG